MNRKIVNLSPMIKAIIGLNILIFVCWYIMPTEFMFNHFLISWDALVEGRIWTLLTSVFSHSLFFHIFINMYVLSSFGEFMIQVLGKKRFLIFYIVAGIFSSFCHAFVSNYYLHSPELPALGASGAISGIVLLFSLLFPQEKLLLMGIIPIRAIWGAAVFVAIDLWGLFAQQAGGGLQIGHGAHLGGALAGVSYYLFLRKRFNQLS